MMDIRFPVDQRLYLNTIQKKIGLGVSMFLQSKFDVRGLSRLGIVLLLLDVPIGMNRVACAEEFEQNHEETIDEIIS